MEPTTTNQLLAALGDADAERGLGAGAVPLLPAIGTDGEAVRRWKRVIRWIGKAPCVGALLPYAKLAVQVYERSASAASNQGDRFISPGEGAAPLFRTVHNLEQWVQCPCAAHRMQIAAAAPSRYAVAAGHLSAAVHAVDVVCGLAEAALAEQRFDRGIRAALNGVAAIGIPASEIESVFRSYLITALRLKGELPDVC